MKDLFEVTAFVKSGCCSLIWYTQRVDKVRLEHDADRVSLEQLARCFLFYLISAVIFLNASSTDYLQLLVFLKNLRDLSKYSWGVTAFSHIYFGFDVACRGGSQICSYLFMLDVSVISCLY